MFMLAVNVLVLWVTLGIVVEFSGICSVGSSVCMYVCIYVCVCVFVCKREGERIADCLLTHTHIHMQRSSFVQPVHFSLTPTNCLQMDIAIPVS